jgi:hypothetical protein
VNWYACTARSPDLTHWYTRYSEFKMKLITSFKLTGWTFNADFNTWAQQLCQYYWSYLVKIPEIVPVRSKLWNCCLKNSCNINNFSMFNSSILSSISSHHYRSVTFIIVKLSHLKQITVTALLVTPDAYPFCTNVFCLPCVILQNRSRDWPVEWHTHPHLNINFYYISDRIIKAK